MEISIPLTPNPQNMSFLRTAVLTLLIALGIVASSLPAFAEPTIRDLNVNFDAQNGATREGYIDSFKWGFGSYFFGGDLTGERGAKYLMITIARDVKNLVTLLAVVYLFIMVINIIFSNGSDEDVKKWRSGIISATLGIIVMQIAYVVVATLYDRRVIGYTAFDLLDKVVYPFVRMLELLASFVFLAMAFYAFYLIITA